ncbi:type 1 glutamine amidotransferase domain-containing protein [soil metagenome]
MLSIRSGEIQAMNGDIDKGDTIPVDRLVGEATVDEFDALVLPGGTMNPDNLRQDDAAVGFVRDFFATGKPVGLICHGPWTLVEADVVRGRTLTSFPSVRTDIRNAGGIVVDEEVVTDRGLVSSRSPDDLPAFCRKIVEEFAEGAHQVHDEGATARA